MLFGRSRCSGNHVHHSFDWHMSVKPEFSFAAEFTPEQMDELLAKSTFHKWPTLVANDEVLQLMTEYSETLPDGENARLGCMLVWITTSLTAAAMTAMSLIGWYNTALMFERMAKKFREKGDTWKKESAN